MIRDAGASWRRCCSASKSVCELLISGQEYVSSTLLCQRQTKCDPLSPKDGIATPLPFHSWPLVVPPKAPPTAHAQRFHTLDSRYQ